MNHQNNYDNTFLKTQENDRPWQELTDNFVVVINSQIEKSIGIITEYKVTYGEYTYCKRVALDLVLKPRALVASKAPRGRYDFGKPKNTTDLFYIGNQIKNKCTIAPSGVIRNHYSPAYLKPKIQLLAEFCPPSVWHKICWYPWTVGKSVF